MADQNIVKVLASVESIRFYRDQWGIILCSIDQINEGKLQPNVNNEYIFKGAMPKPVRGNSYKITAEEVNDPKWGLQYNIINICNGVDITHEDNDSKRKFLASIFNVNQVEAMYEALEDPFQTLLDQDYFGLSRVRGVQLKTATSWIIRFQENLFKAKIFIELEDYNLTNNMVDRLLRQYQSPDVVVEKVRHNPYVLCTEVDGIGWKRADQIALAGGMKEDDVKRIGAYIIYYLNMRAENGFSWLTPDELLGAVLEELGEEMPDAKITQAIKDNEYRLWWNNDKSKIGLQRYFNLENNVARELIRLRNADSYFKCDGWREKVKTLEEYQGWCFGEEQMKAIEMVLENNVSLVYGYSGTGKTSSVKAMLEVLGNYTFVQTSLSGRAASRMSEVTGAEGYTIHRLLGYPKGEPENQLFLYHRSNLLPYDIYILDEVSMVDVRLLYYLLRAIPSGAKLVMMGDAGQLEAIGAGNVAYDVIRSPEIPSICLTQIHRQAAQSGIITESMKVRKGIQLIEKDWTGKEIRGELKDFHLQTYSDASNTYYEIMKEFMRLMSQKDFDIMECQIIVPVKEKGGANTSNLNNAIQEEYNPIKKGMDDRDIFKNGKVYNLRVGDKVINVQNNYKTDPPIYNGNIGIIVDFDYAQDKDGEILEVMEIDFMGIGVVQVPKKDWSNIELAYAITVHKIQGSESKNVIFGLDFASYALLSRELVYTGITRAKQNLYLKAQTGALRYAIAQEAVSQKQTHLQDCLYDIAHPKLIF